MNSIAKVLRKEKNKRKTVFLYLLKITKNPTLTNHYYQSMTIWSYENH